MSPTPEERRAELEQVRDLYGEVPRAVADSIPSLLFYLAHILNDISEKMDNFQTAMHVAKISSIISEAGRMEKKEDQSEKFDSESHRLASGCCTSSNKKQDPPQEQMQKRKEAQPAEALSL